MRSLQREPALLLALLAVTALVLLFVVYPQLQVVLTPGPGGYVQYLQEGTWVGPLRNSIQLTLLSTTTAVVLGFVYAYAMVYSNMRWKPFFRLVGILPLLSPPFVVGAAILTTAIYILEDFGNPQLIGGTFYVLPTQAYSLISSFGEFTSAAAVSTILLLLALGLYLAKVRLDGGRSFVTISGRASSMPRPPVSPSVSRACFVACLGLAGVILLVYGSLVGSAVTLRFPNNLQFTTEHFQYVLSGRNGEALRNTLVFSGVAAAVSAVFALFAGWLVPRWPWPGPPR